VAAQQALFHRLLSLIRQRRETIAHSHTLGIMNRTDPQHLPSCWVDLCLTTGRISAGPYSV